MNTQSEIAESAPATQHPRQNGMELRDSSARNETAVATANASHSAQQLGSGCWRIAVIHCVTSCDPRKAILDPPPFNQPMKKEAIIALN
jgi:energy-coupling factor transporter ATP-binding protein EcfA2